MGVQHEASYGLPADLYKETRMDFPKRMLVVGKAVPLSIDPHWEAAETLLGLPVELLPDGVEVAIYRLSRVKRLEISRKLVKANASDPDDGDDTPAEQAPPVQA